MSSSQSLTSLSKNQASMEKDSKMIDHNDKYFNLSGIVDSLGYIFDLIYIKHAANKSVITLKADSHVSLPPSKWGV
jgi:hypothetical protein